MSRSCHAFIALAFLASCADMPAPLDPGPPYPLDDLLRLDHLQMRGTHNSYHLEPEDPIHASHRYSHAPLPEQLELQGVRAFELDIHLDEPGMPLSVYHVRVNQARIDAETTCERFIDCLSGIRTWADINRGHAPIMIWIEVKDDLGGWPIEDLDQLEDEILSIIPRSRILTPDDVRGEHDTLRQALATDGWPLLLEARNKFVFLIIESELLQEVYTRGHSDLHGRLAFMRAEPDQFDMPWAAVAKINDPRAVTDIQAAHAARILVASNLCAADLTDIECEEKRMAGLENGVHMLKDDIPAPIEGREYWLDIPDGTPVRCNPVSAPAACTSLAIENLAQIP